MRSRSAMAGFALAYLVHDLSAGAALIDRALALNPNLAVGVEVERLGKDHSRRAGIGHRTLYAFHAPEPTRSVDVCDIPRDLARSFLRRPL